MGGWKEGGFDREINIFSSDFAFSQNQPLMRPLERKFLKTFSSQSLLPILSLSFHLKTGQAKCAEDGIESVGHEEEGVGGDLRGDTPIENGAI